MAKQITRWFLKPLCIALVTLHSTSVNLQIAVRVLLTGFSLVQFRMLGLYTSYWYRNCLWRRWSCITKISRPVSRHAIQILSCLRLLLVRKWDVCWVKPLVASIFFLNKVFSLTFSRISCDRSSALFDCGHASTRWKKRKGRPTANPVFKMYSV